MQKASRIMFASRYIYCARLMAHGATEKYLIQVSRIRFFFVSQGRTVINSFHFMSFAFLHISECIITDETCENCWKRNVDTRCFT